MTREKHGLHIGDDFSASGSGIQQQNLLKSCSSNTDLSKVCEYPKRQGHHTDHFAIGRFQYSTHKLLQAL